MARPTIEEIYNNINAGRYVQPDASGKIDTAVVYASFKRDVLRALYLEDVDKKGVVQHKHESAEQLFTEAWHTGAGISLAVIFNEAQLLATRLN